MRTEQGPINYYDILGVKPNASAEEIKAAYRARIAAYHPDRNRSTHANAIAALINEAWEVLGDPERRRVYDDTVAANGSRSRQSEPEGNASSPPPKQPPQSKQGPPHEHTDDSSGRWAWVCSHCGRHVPRYADRCRCGQQRESAATDSRESQDIPPSAGTTKVVLDIRRLGLAQRSLILAASAVFAAFPIGFIVGVVGSAAEIPPFPLIGTMFCLNVLVSVLAIYYTFKLARACDASIGVAIVWVLATLIRYYWIGPVCMLVLVANATRILRQHGIKVGLLGAKVADLQSYSHAGSSTSA